MPVLGCIVFSNRNWNAIANDTLLLFGSFEMLERFSSLFSNANSNPLQALFDIFPSGLRLDAFPNLVGRALFGPGKHVELFYIVCGVLLAFAVTTMARTVGLRWGVAVLGGMLVPLVLLPTFGQFPLAEHFFLLWPISYYSTAGAVLVTALFWRIDGQRRDQSAVLTAVIIAVLVHLSVVQILFMTLLAPAIVAMGIGALAASESRRELLTKIICALIVMAALAAAGIFHYLYALGISTASHVFYQELIDFMLFSGPNWKVFLDDIGSVIINPFTYSYLGTYTIDGVLVPLSQLGAIHLAIFGATRDARIFGRTMLAWVAATAVTIAILHNFYHYTGRMYQGPDPRHFVPILWPFYMICLAHLIVIVAERGAALLLRIWPITRQRVNYVPHALVISILALPVAYIGTNKLLSKVAPAMALPTEFFRTVVPSFREFRPTALTDYLQATSRVAVDHDFRGSVVFMPSDYHRHVKPYHGSLRETTFNYARFYLANDLGGFALRHYNVPTLDEFTHNITPQFYLTTRELLSRPGTDIYDKHFTLVTRLNEPIMALLGVRHIIADYELPFGTERLAMPLPEEARKVFESAKRLKSPVRVYELSHPNLGNYSPTNVVAASTAKAVILALSNPSFDGRQTVITDDASIGGNLVAATDVAMTVRMGGVGLRASSTGESILVLPVQYSHCWRVVSGGEATLFRANLMQLGVRFSGQLRLELRQFFGPFWQSGCRMVDAADVERLRMADAVGAGAQRQRIPGDGINLIPETLDAVLPSSAIATVEPVGAENAPVREYRITARGESSEYYSVLTLPKLTPGIYTFSMQVRAESSPRIALQLKDAGDNGVFAEYILSVRNVWTHRLGKGDKLHATIQKLDDDWLQLTVTTVLETQTAYAFVHLGEPSLKDALMRRPNAVTIRAVKLERGETATPYAGHGQ